jgi:hypothetical protein
MAPQRDAAPSHPPYRDRMTSHDPTRSRNTPSADVSRASAALLPLPRRRRRPPLALAAAAIFATGLATHYLLTGWFADALADGLYTALIAVTIVLIAPRLRPWVAATAAFALSAAVELLQLTTLPAALAESVPLSRLILGTTFAPLDLVFYAVAALIVGMLDAAALRARRSTPPVLGVVEEPYSKSGVTYY